MSNEKQTCPSRMNQCGPWDRKENIDEWHPDRYEDWKWPWIPRTCSFCGGIHPDDAVKLLRENWECEPTGKYYKRYLSPPGYLKHVNEICEKIGTSEKPKEFWLPNPMVKLYVWHLDDEHKKLFNIELDRQDNEKA